METPFIDLKKAYNSVPQKCSVVNSCEVWSASNNVNIIQPFHEGMEASVRVRDSVTVSFEVRNGLRQGCIIAPTLFNHISQLNLRCRQYVLVSLNLLMI